MVLPSSLSLTEKRENLTVSQRMAMILKDHSKKATTAPVPQHLLVKYLKKA